MSKGEELFNNEYFAVANTNFNLAENICNVLLEKDRFDFMAKKLLGNVLGKRAVNHFCWSEDKSEAIKDRDRSFALRLRPPSPLEVSM